jgi:hypothetical protein
MVAWRLLAQAQRQLTAPEGTAIRWVFAEKRAADIVRRMTGKPARRGLDLLALPAATVLDL